jgi:hypothetical protein
MATDDENKARWREVIDAKTALNEIIEFWDFIGSDPYYRDLNDALFEMAARVSIVETLLDKEEDDNG